MKYVTIPRTDLRVSNLCLGTGEVGSSLNRQSAFQLLDARGEAEVRAIFTPVMRL